MPPAPPPNLVVWLVAGKNPYQLWLMWYLAAVGIGLAAKAPAPQSVEAITPDWAVRMWGVSLLVGSAMNLIGVYWRGRDPEPGIWSEIVGSAVFAIANLVYPIALISRVFNGTPEERERLTASWLIVGLVIVLSLCATARVWQLRGTLREVRRIHLPGSVEL